MQKGYTLIELILAVGLIALLAAFTVPTFQLILSQLQLSTATSQTGDLLRLAEQRTVTEQQIYSVAFTAGSATVTETLAGSALYTLTLPSNIVVDSANFGVGVSTVQFTTAGAPSTSGNMVLHDTIRNVYRQIDVRPSGAIIEGPERSTP